MSNLSDKDIDRLSRNAAEFYEPDDSMLSWNRLEENLVKHIPERPPDTPSFFRMRPLVWGPAVLLLAGISYYLIKNISHSQVSTLKTQSEINSRNSSRANGTNLIPGSGQAVNPGAKNASPAKDSLSGINVLSEPEMKKENKYPPNASSKSLVSGTIAENGNSLSNPERDKPLKRKGRGIPSMKHPLQNNLSERIASNRPLSSDKVGEGPGWNKSSATENSQHDASGMPGSGISKQNATDQSAHIVKLPMPVIPDFHPVVRGNDSSLNRYASSGSTQKPALSKSLRINHSLSIGLVTGPDYTHVGNMSNNQLGDNFGISVGYYLTSRLSVNTGFQYTTKYYLTEGKLFQPRPTNNLIIAAYAFPRIESVNGSCTMYEIPLTLRYDFIHQGKTRLFVNAGFSSYLMRNQEYTYFFHNAGRAYEWKNENNEHLNYWLAVGNFSAGIEQDFGKGFSFQAEPFLRLPFRGMGVGDMKMNSVGLLFSIRFSPVLGRTRK